VFGQRRRIDDHSNGYEEDRREHVPYWPDESLELDLVSGFGYERAGNEGAKSHGVAECERDKSGGEADTDAGNERGLRLTELLHRADRPRHDENPEPDESGEEHSQPHRGHENVRR
jgi:hypothetical protein